MKYCFLKKQNQSIMSIDRSFTFHASNSTVNELKIIREKIDMLGVESGLAQSLIGPITSVEKFISSDHTLVVFFESGGSGSTSKGDPIGFIKYGPKDLYFYEKNGKVVQRIGALCLLDFYVSTSVQRNGIGLALFNKMLQNLGLAPTQLAYDRPSPKLLSFLKKHFGLTNPDQQPNRYTIYEGYL